MAIGLLVATFVWFQAHKLFLDDVNLGLLKGNIGNQNYEVPAEVDVDALSTVVLIGS